MAIITYVFGEIAFQNFTDQAINSIRIDRTLCFENFDIPDPPPAKVPFQFLSLNSNCNAIDAGLALDNINDQYLGSAPDLGVYEYGAELPQYGPRDEVIVSLKDFVNDIDIKIFPNPGREIINIDFGDAPSDLIWKYKLIDVSKRIFISGDVQNNKIPLNTASSGLYFLILTNDNNKSVSKIINSGGLLSCER